MRKSVRTSHSTCGKAVLVDLGEDIHEATMRLKGKGMLLVRGKCDEEIVGVLTAFDLLV